MITLEKTPFLVKKFKEQQSGSMALTWALSMMASVLAIGATYDLSRISQAKQNAQSAADTMALAAAISQDTGNKKLYEENKRYSFGQIGAPSADFTGTMKGYVVYDIVDDADPANENLDDKASTRLLARATVEGKYKPAFMGAFGVKNIPFSVISDVSYASSRVSHASVFFVTDNSLSMANTDIEGTVKLTALKNTLNQFMVRLDELNPDDKDTFRTALFPYDGQDPKSNKQSYNGLIKNRIVNPMWGSIESNKINQMKAQKFTDSSGALGVADQKFKLEANIHKNHNGETNPLKFLVFMTDGLNNPVNERQCRTEERWQKPTKEYWTYKKNCGGNNPKLGTTVFSKPKNNIKDWKYYKGTPGRWATKKVCDDNGCTNEPRWIKPTREHWKYYPKGNVCGTRVFKRPSDSNNWKHTPVKPGYFKNVRVCKGSAPTYLRNEKSLASCNAMKASGVKIYTIAYDVEPEDKAAAEAFMQSCSSGEEYFKSAGSATALEDAFEQIGMSIVEEVIRIKR